ncbi:flagellar biosynthetic protein FliP [Halobacteroides halobius DSM 5150]|uniref:Flagellar biosynthetic protein FliP n=1 Tax=Halobacteroides halobius (strain ATCC 35273 / DSM 5150 / MD-1) TaxID=748449 RepID=U3GKJ6_HALHC|nr:flagellar type III secretion system pore protein FliP [Halobacteroides halobius]AGB40642.1 flagellar biosynthetic protein FliP [Halobacteroides halobius DSM 5150]
MKAKYQLTGILIIVILLVVQASAIAAPRFEIPSIKLQVGDDGSQPQELALSLKILLLLTILTLAPAILILLTSFTRIIVVLSFLRRALATQRMPPNQVLIGLAIFLTIYIMAPVGQDINQNALQPYLAEKIDRGTAFDRTIKPLRRFMFKQTREKDIALFVNLSNSKRPKGPKELSTYVLIPAFIISELKTAFQIGFMIYLPFVVIDMIVASTLMSMGMMMLPPVMISLPFKILLFVLVDGWYLVIKSLVETFK